MPFARINYNLYVLTFASGIAACLNILKEMTSHEINCVNRSTRCEHDGKQSSMSRRPRVQEVTKMMLCLFVVCDTLDCQVAHSMRASQVWFGYVLWYSYWVCLLVSLSFSFFFICLFYLFFSSFLFLIFNF